MTKILWEPGVEALWEPGIAMDWAFLQRSFPLVSPEPFGLASVRWTARSNDAYGRNQFTLALIKQIFDGRMWEGTVTVLPQNEADGRALTAWLTALRRTGTNAGTFLLGDPSASEPLGSAKDTPGTPIVSGAGQTGEVLNVSGLPNNVTGYLLAGDYIQIGTGVTARLKKVIDDVESNHNGFATMGLWPPMRVAPVNGSVITVSTPKGLFVEPSGISSWQVRPPKIHPGVVLNVAEVVP